MKKEKSCGAIIFDEKFRVLLIKHNKGHWSFPKGHIEEGETEVETALREVKEETNLDIEIDSKYKWTSTYMPEDDVIKDVIYFLGFPKNNNIILQTSELCDYLWCNIDEALKIITYVDDRQILKMAYNKLKTKR